MKALVSDRDHFLGLPNWTFPLFLSSLKLPLSSHVTQSLIHINQHLNETAHCATDLKIGRKVSPSLSDITLIKGQMNQNFDLFYFSSILVKCV